MYSTIFLNNACFITMPLPAHSSPRTSSHAFDLNLIASIQTTGIVDDDLLCSSWGPEAVPAAIAVH